MIKTHNVMQESSWLLNILKCVFIESYGKKLSSSKCKMNKQELLSHIICTQWSSILQEAVKYKM